MRKTQRRASAREWIRSGADVTIKTYTKRYGVDRYTAHDDLTALRFPLPTAARQWAQRPPPGPPQTSEQATSDVDTDWIMLDGRPFFVAGYTSGGAPYGMFEDEMQPLTQEPAQVGLVPSSLLRLTFEQSPGNDYVA